MEALNWLKNNKNTYCFASNHFDNKNNVIKFINKLYKLGVTNIEISNIMDEEWRLKSEGGPYADTLLITLPKAKNKRLDLQAAVFEERPDEVTAHIENAVKVNWNKHNKIYLWWD